jgi:hypothetical protein
MGVKKAKRTGRMRRVEARKQAAAQEEWRLPLTDEQLLTPDFMLNVYGAQMRANVARGFPVMDSAAVSYRTVIAERVAKDLTEATEKFREITRLQDHIVYTKWLVGQVKDNWPADDEIDGDNVMALCYLISDLMEQAEYAKVRIIELTEAL